MTNAHFANPDGSAPHQNSHSEIGNEASQGDSFPPGLPPLSPEVLDCLNARLAQEDSNTLRSPQECALDRIGLHVRRWRQEQAYPRAVLARMLRMDASQLTCIENGIAQPGGISEEQLLALKALLPPDATALRAAIDEYLSASTAL